MIRRITAVLIIIVFGLLAQIVIAASLEPPADFTATDMGGSTANLTWTHSGNATSALIRMKRNTFPTTTTEGELIYSGNATSVNVTGLSLDTTRYYFSAWGSDGVSYSDTYTTASIGGSGMMSIAIVILPIALAALGLAFRNGALMMAAALGWIAFSAFHLADPVTSSSVVNILAPFGIVVGMLCAFEAMRLFGVVGRGANYLLENKESKEQMKRVREAIDARRTHQTPKPRRSLRLGK
jgi:hypothetical protein